MGDRRASAHQTRARRVNRPRGEIEFSSQALIDRLHPLHLNQLVGNRHVQQIFSVWQAKNPHPTTELRFRTPFQLLVAVILSAQSTDKMVNRTTGALFKLAPSATKMANLDLATIESTIGRLGLFRNKASFLRQTSRILVEKYRGRIPRTREELMQLPGVGRKTANVVLNTLYGDNEIAVDTHIYRVANRMGIARAKTVRAVEEGLKKCIPPRYQLYAHHWLILHGRYVCKAIKPLCGQCAVAQWCPQFNRTLDPRSSKKNGNVRRSSTSVDEG